MEDTKTQIKVSDLSVGDKAVTMENLTVLFVGEERTVRTKTGETLTVQDFTVSDESQGMIKVPIWEGQGSSIKLGDRLNITNGYVTEWKDQLQLNVGKYGTFDVVSAQSSLTN